VVYLPPSSPPWSTPADDFRDTLRAA
jgi:hypothetical protein